MDQFMKEDSKVYGVVVDMPLAPKVLGSLVCFVNGAANLYFNMGGGVVGPSQRYRAVAHAARTLVLSAEQALPICEKVKGFDLPVGKFHYVYLLTRNGVYRTSIIPEELTENDTMKRMLFFCYQSVMSEIRTAQLKDEAIKSRNTNEQ
jgi:hypothetical protein